MHLSRFFFSISRVFPRLEGSSFYPHCGLRESLPPVASVSSGLSRVSPSWKYIHWPFLSFLPLTLWVPDLHNQARSTTDWGTHVPGVVHWTTEHRASYNFITCQCLKLTWFGILKHTYSPKKKKIISWLLSNYVQVVLCTESIIPCDSNMWGKRDLFLT